MATNGKVRIGFIGAGGIAHHHLRLLKDVPEAEVVALSDPSEQSIARIKERFPALAGVPAFSDYREMLDQVEMDAVEIHSPHTVHYEQMMASLAKGLHVLCEKPMVCRVEHAREVKKMAEQTGKVLAVSYQRHFDPVFRYMRERIQAGDLGKVTFVCSLSAQDWLEGCRGTWRHDPALSGGGQVNDTGSHFLDIILWMLDDPVEEVFAIMENFDVPVDINSAITVKFASGALANLSIVGDSPNWWEEHTIWGKKGAFYLRNGKLTEVIRGKEPRAVEGLTATSNTDRNFVDAILGRDEVQAPPLCGLRVTQLTNAAWESARTGQPVKVEQD